MNRPSRKFKALITVGVIVLVGLITYFVILPEAIAAQYIERVHRMGSSLRTGYRQLEASTSRTLIDDPTVTEVSLTPDVEQLRNLLRENRITLDKFSLTAKDYHPLPFTGFTTQAGAAHALQTRSVAFTEQSQDAFTKYDELIDFIKHYDDTVAGIEQYLKDFNAHADLNIYAGQADQVQSIADQIRQDIHSLDTAKTPHEAVEFKAASIQAFRQIADGFETVALGLRIPADDVIYSGARQIEAVDQTINGPNQAIYSRDILSSRTIKTIQELREKLDLILP